MGMEKGNDLARGYLLSRVEVRARLLTRMASVRKALAPYPNLLPVRSGTHLEYLLQDEDTRDHFYSVSIGDASASITIYSKTTPLYFIQEAVLRFLGIIQAIGKDYEVHLPSLYPYLMLALSNQQTRRTLLEAPPARRGIRTSYWRGGLSNS